MAPADFSSDLGCFAFGAPICSGRSLFGVVLLALYRTFFFSLFFGLLEKDYVLIIKKLILQCCTACPKH